MKKLLFFLCLVTFCAFVHAQSSRDTWNLLGNGGTTSSNFFGTTDSNPIIFKTREIERMRLMKDKSFLGIGIPIPQASLHLHFQADSLLGNPDFPRDIGPQPQSLPSKLLLRLTTSDTGVEDTSGFSIFYTDKNIYFKQYEQAYFYLYGPSRKGLAITPDGNVEIGGGLKISGNTHTSGKVGIGISNPSQPLHVVGNTYLNGNLGVGISNPSQKLHVVGNALINGTLTTKELTITLTGWSDYVFNKDYELRSLSDLEIFIKQHNHLPEIPSEQEVLRNGIDIGDMQSKLLMKIEELTLYILEQDKQMKELENRISEMENKKGYE